MAGSALLRSVVSKMGGMTAGPRAPHLVLLSGCRPAQTASRRPFSSSSHQDPSQTMHSAKTARISHGAKVAYSVMFGTSVFMYVWVKPRLEELSDEMATLRRERSILIKAVEECQRTHMKPQDVLMDSPEAQSKQAIGQGKESDGHEAS